MKSFAPMYRLGYSPPVIAQPIRRKDQPETAQARWNPVYPALPAATAAGMSYCASGATSAPTLCPPMRPTGARFPPMSAPSGPTSTRQAPANSATPTFRPLKGGTALTTTPLPTTSAAVVLNNPPCGSHPSLNNRTAFPFKIPGTTSGLNPAPSKSFSHLSGVMSG